MKAKYKNKKFKTEEAFNKWLKETAKYLLHIEDKGQDFLEWWLDERGEVLHSDMQSFVWNGNIVNIKRVKKNKKIVLNGIKTLNYKARKLELLT